MAEREAFYSEGIKSHTNFQSMSDADREEWIKKDREECQKKLEKLADILPGVKDKLKWSLNNNFK